MFDLFSHSIKVTLLIIINLMFSATKMGVPAKNPEAMDVEIISPESQNGDGDISDKKDTDLQSIHDIREHTRQIEKAVQSKEPRFILRALRTLPNTRRRLNSNVLRGVIVSFYSKPCPERDALLSWLEEPTESEETQKLRISVINPLPEIDAYIHLLVLVHLIDSNKHEEAVQCSEILLQKIIAQNRRTIDLIAAKCYFYYSRAYELVGRLDKIRGLLHLRLRTATLRNDFEGQAVLINCLLRNYLHYNLYDQADKLVLKSTFPESASNNEWARFLYYLGRIKAARLEYSAAHKYLVQVS